MLTFNLTEEQANIVRDALTEFHDDIVEIIPDIRNDDGDDAAAQQQILAGEVDLVRDIFAKTVITKETQPAG